MTLIDRQTRPVANREPCLRSRPYRTQSGFTLVEALVVLSIIGLIMGLAGPRVLSYLGDAKVKTARLQIENIGSALDLFYMDVGRYPETNEGLSGLIQRPSTVDGWNGPYMRVARLPNDPWGRSYVYRSPGTTNAYELISLGPDGKEGSSGVIRRADSDVK